VEEIAAEHADKLDVAKVNVDENPGLAQQYGVMSIPMLAVFQDGNVVKTVIGAKPKAALLRDLAPYV
jgi:thioredoxin 1